MNELHIVIICCIIAIFLFGQYRLWYSTSANMNKVAGVAEDRTLEKLYSKSDPLDKPSTPLASRETEQSIDQAENIGTEKAAERVEAERVATEQKIEAERVATEKKKEAERIEAERVAAEKKKEAEQKKEVQPAVIENLRKEPGDESTVPPLMNNEDDAKEYFRKLENGEFEYPPVDVVYTWVNGSDPVWLEAKEKYHGIFVAEMLGQPSPNQVGQDNELANGVNRYRNHNELRYSLRSIEKFAPWVRKIHIVVADGQVPSWLNTEHPKVALVPHSKMYANPDHLPVFSGVTVESNLDGVPDLAEYFMYMNDDMFLGNYVSQADFFASVRTGRQVVYYETYGPRWKCQGGCEYRNIGDSKCDQKCMVATCGWDFGDCGKNHLIDGKAEIRKGLNLKSRRTFKLGTGDFLTSLIYTEGVLNREFGANQKHGIRKIIRHTPYMVNRKMLRDARLRLAPEFIWTSSHRFRHPEDLQFSYFYYHYLDGVKVYAPTNNQLWYHALHTTRHNQTFLIGDEGGLIAFEEKEAKKFATISETSSFKLFEKCSLEIIGNKPMTDAQVTLCKTAAQVLVDDENIRLPCASPKVGNGEHLDFNIIDSKVGYSLQKFANVMKNKRKFVTLNDDMTSYSKEIEQGYTNTYLSFFPNAAEFEKH